jgi:hypothetical protein
MTPREHELLQGMVNCYHVCHANFDDTVQMVSSARGLSSKEVKETLQRLRKEDGEEYRILRNQLPQDFPL